MCPDENIGVTRLGVRVQSGYVCDHAEWNTSKDEASGTLGMSLAASLRVGEGTDFHGSQFKESMKRFEMEK